MYICMYMQRDRERKSERKREREGGREGDSHTPASRSTSLPGAGIAAPLSRKFGTCKTVNARFWP